MMGPKEKDLSEPERLARLALYLGLNFNGTYFHQLLKLFGSATEFFSAPKEIVRALQTRHLNYTALLDQASEELAKANTKGVKLYFFGARDYPSRLLEIGLPPPVLWALGEVSKLDDLAISLVGSRKASSWGLRQTYNLALEAAQAGLTVISGLAKGIDTAAHQGALAGGGRTIAVCAGGVDWIYPVENKKLHQKISENGAVISEMPLNYKPAPYLFPRRNRVIAGLGLAVVVMEGGKKSGALITAKFALEQNREVLAFPGQAGKLESQGCNYLIRSGATLAENLTDVLNEIKPHLKAGLNSGLPLLNYQENQKKIKEDKEENLKSNPHLQDGPTKKLCLLLEKGSLSMDDLIRLSDLKVNLVSETLLILELEGLIKRNLNAQYELL